MKKFNKKKVWDIVDIALLLILLGMAVCVLVLILLYGGVIV